MDDEKVLANLPEFIAIDISRFTWRSVLIFHIQKFSTRGNGSNVDVFSLSSHDMHIRSYAAVYRQNTSLVCGLVGAFTESDAITNERPAHSIGWTFHFYCSLLHLYTSAKTTDILALMSLTGEVGLGAKRRREFVADAELHIAAVGSEGMALVFFYAGD